MKEVRIHDCRMAQGTSVVSLVIGKTSGVGTMRCSDVTGRDVLSPGDRLTSDRPIDGPHC
jgi:hypothetical protein